MEINLAATKKNKKKNKNKPESSLIVLAMKEFVFGRLRFVLPVGVQDDGKTPR